MYRIVTLKTDEGKVVAERIRATYSSYVQGYADPVTVSEGRLLGPINFKVEMNNPYVLELGDGIPPRRIVFKIESPPAEDSLYFQEIK